MLTAKGSAAAEVKSGKAPERTVLPSGDELAPSLLRFILNSLRNTFIPYAQKVCRWYHLRAFFFEKSESCGKMMYIVAIFAVFKTMFTERFLKVSVGLDKAVKH